MEDTLPLTELNVLDDSIIKVVGVGGGGCNAVNYMYRQGVNDISFLVCNTDNMALEKMSVPAKLQLGPGLGAGGRPERAHELATENEDKIRTALDDGTRMIFLTAGMGGGTGTGASPVVAQIAKEMGILTVGIVTIPFLFEGKRQIRKALRGVRDLAQHTDALLVINNERLRILFPDFDLPNAFRSSDEVLCNAAKSIAEIITRPGYINTDFQDVYNTLKNGNIAIMNVGYAEGEQRITKAIQNALTSPLVDMMDVQGASRILLNFYCSEENAIRMQELDEVTDFCDSMGDVEIKWGMAYDNDLGEQVKVTIIATGYSVTDIPGFDEAVETEEVVAEPEDKSKRISVEEAMNKLYDNIGNKEEEEVEEEEVPAEAEEETVEVDDTPIMEGDDLEIVLEEPIVSKPHVTALEDIEIELPKEEPDEVDNDWRPAWMRRKK